MNEERQKEINEFAVLLQSLLKQYKVGLEINIKDLSTPITTEEVKEAEVVEEVA